MITKETNELLQKVFGQIRAANDSTLLIRVDTYTKAKMGKKLMELAAGGDDETKKREYLTEVCEILESKEYSKFGETPEGQVDAPAPKKPAKGQTQGLTAATILKGKEVKKPEKRTRDITEVEWQLLENMKEVLGGRGTTEERVREIVREEVKGYMASVFK